MKKLISLTLAALLLLSLVGCQLKEDTPPAGTTTSTTAAITTQAPVTTAPPAMTEPAFSVSYEKLQAPYGSSEEYASWLASLNLPETLPTDLLEYDYLRGYEDPDSPISEVPFQKTILISTSEELEFFFESLSTMELSPDIRQIYEEVDLSKQSILIISGYWPLLLDNFGLRTVVWQDEALIAVFEADGDGSCGDMEAMERSYAIAVDKADLPAGGNTEVYYSIEFSDPSQFPGYPNLYYPDNRYVFVPIDEEE